MNESSTIARSRIAIVEDHRLQRIGLEQLIETTGRYRTVCSTETAPQLTAWLARCAVSDRPELVILDLRVDRQPDVEPEFVSALLEARIRVLIYSAFTNPRQVQRILALGAVNAVSKRDASHDVLAAIDATLHGTFWRTAELGDARTCEPTRPKLSAQEARALSLHATGNSLGATAEAMGIGRETVKQYIDRVRAKYAEHGIALHSQFDLARMAWNEGYVERALPHESAHRTSR